MRAAIVGLGAVSPVHIEAIKSLGVEICAFCDIDLTRMQKFKVKYAPYAQSFSDFDEMLLKAKPDVIHICTPHDLHVSMAVSALEKNIHTLLEKPAGISEADIEKLLEAEKSSKANLGICLQNRYLPGNIKVKELLAKGKAQYKAKLTLLWQRDKEYFASSPWRGQKVRSGGGALINQAIHSLDLLEWFFGPVQEVNCTIKTEKFAELIDTEESAFGSIKFANGHTAEFDVTIAADKNEPVTTVIEGKHNIILTAGNLVLDGEKIDFTDLPYNAHKDYWGVGHSLLIKDFYNCIKEEKPFGINGQEGAKSAKLVLECYNAATKETI